MKKLILLLIASTAALPLASQSVASPRPINRTGVKPQLVSRPPDAQLPRKLARLNTAQRGAAFNPQPPPKQLPAFNLNDASGTFAARGGMSRTGHWLLLYRRDNCLPCDRLMNVLAVSKSPDLQTGLPLVVIVEGKAADAAEQVRPNFKSMNKASWLTDSHQQVRAQLKARGAPMLYAMNGSKIAWNVPGNLGDPTRVERMAASWVTPPNTTNIAAAATQ